MKWRVLRAMVIVVALGGTLSQSVAATATPQTGRASVKQSAIGDPDGGSDARGYVTFGLRVPIIRYGDPDLGGGSGRTTFWYRMVRVETVLIQWRWQRRGPSTR